MQFRLIRKAGLTAVAFLIAVLMICIPFLRAALNEKNGGQQRHRLEGTYHWAKKYYLDGRFRGAEKKLKRLLSYITPNGTSQTAYLDLRWRTLLLLAEVSEIIGKKKAAAKYLQEAHALTAKLKKS